MDPSADALTTVEAVKDYLLGKSEAIPEEHDDLIRRIINSVSSELLHFFGRQLRSAARTEKYTGSSDQKDLFLNHWPITAVATVTIDGTAITEGTASDNYIQIKDAFGDVYKLFREDGWDSEPHGIVVTYTAGWTLPPAANYTLPPDLEYAAIELCGDEYLHRGKAGISTESYAGLSLTFDRWPMKILKTLQRYAIVRV